jgi:pimeloyl-ACP methyl ester carboxylesterase/DNA-binding CsgD family transcriptional regulator
MSSRVNTPHPHLRPVPATDAGWDASPDVTLAAIEALYAFAEEPAKWEDVIQAIESLPEDLDPAQHSAAAKISSHAQRAAALAERLNEGRRNRAPVAPWDAILLSSEGRVRAIIGAAENRLTPFANGAVTIGNALALKPEARNAFTAAMDAVAQSNGKALAPFTLMDERSAVRLFGVVIARDAFPAELSDAFQLSDVWAEPLLAAVFLSHQEHKPLDDVAQTALGLTAAEARLASKLAAGRQIADASAELGISPHTARTQLKGIFAKTGARRQSELIGILSRVSAFGPNATPRFKESQVPAPPRRFVTLSDGRKLFYREYGSPQGSPAIYMHIGLAASLILMDLPEAAKGKLRILAPERPGFGQSSPAAEYSFEGVTRDLEEFLDALKLRTVALIGDGTGGAFALHAAIHAPTRVRALAMRAPRLFTPLQKPGGGFQSAMSAMVRQPWLVRSVIDIVRRGAEVPLLKAMANRWVHNAANDKASMMDEAAIKAFQAQMADALEVSSAGVAGEMKLFQRLPRWDVASLKCPVAMWIGAENSVVQIKETAALIAEARDARINILPDVSISFPRAAWDDIVAWLA